MVSSFRIINNGSKTYHINKIVVEGADVSTELTLDPTSGESEFNYANYVGNKLSDLYNADENYDRSVDIRSYVVPVDGTAEVAQLNVRGTKAERAIAKGKTGYAVVMLNEIAEEDLTDLTATIFTDEGVIANIDLTAEPNLEYEYNEFVLVDKQITEVGYNVKNTVSIKFKDEAVETIMEANVVDNEDLYHLIEWNAASDIKVTPVATLTGKDVELTKEIFDLLKSNENVTLTIQAEDDEALTLAEGLPVNVLDYKGLIINTPIIVATEIELTEDTPVFDDMTITKEGVVTIEEIGAGIPKKIVNEGNINIGSEAIVVFANLINAEKATVTIAAEADVKGGTNSIANYGKIINNGYLENVDNKAYAEIVLGKDAILKLLNNAGEVDTADGSYVQGANTGLINFVTGATLELTGAGKVSAEAPVSVTKDMYKDSGINTLTLKAGQTTTFADGQTGGIKYIIAAEGATLKVADEKSLSLTELTAGAKLTIMGTVVTDKMEIAKDVKVYNYGEVQVTTTWKNEGIVYNNGSVKLPDAVKSNYGTFKYTAPSFGDPVVDTSKPDALKLAVIEFVDEGGYTSYTYANFVDFINNVKAGNFAVYDDTLDYIKEFGVNVSEDEFDAALAAIKAANTTALKTALLANDVTLIAASLHSGSNNIATLYSESGTVAAGNYKSAKTVAYDAFRANVINATLGSSWASVKASVKLAASALSETDVDAILAAKAPTAFIWVGCDLDLAIDVWKKYDTLSLTGNANHDYSAAFAPTVDNANERFVKWALTAMENSTIATELATAGVTIETLKKFSAYTDAQYEACNN